MQHILNNFPQASGDQRGELTGFFQLFIASFTFVLLKVLFLWVNISSAFKKV